MILFDVNLLELGFPKLKNVLHTLTDKLVFNFFKITHKVPVNQESSKD
jgi:hypothetical protein